MTCHMTIFLHHVPSSAGCPSTGWDSSDVFVMIALGWTGIMDFGEEDCKVLFRHIVSMAPIIH